MAEHSAKQVAAWMLATQFQHLAEGDADNDLTNMKLQKLLYYAQGCHLALMGDPLFSEPLVAWKYGPVVESVYEDYKRFRDGPIDEVMGEYDVDDFDPGAADIMEQIMDVFGSYTSSALRRMSRAEKPWREAARMGMGAPLSTETMRKYFLNHHVKVDNDE